MTAKKKTIAVFNAAVSAVQPSQLIPAAIERTETGLKIMGELIVLEKNAKIFVVGAGKAAAAMALATENILADLIWGGVVITKYGHALPLQYISCLEAGHPVPDEAGIHATVALISMVQQAGTNDLVICLISGGASALLVDCPDGIALNELQQVFELLLKSGANIEEMNIVRKHFSDIKGGQLLKAAPAAAWYTLVISDVPGDDLSVIASGPTVPDVSSFSDVSAVLKKYKLDEGLPDSVQAYLLTALQGKLPETPKPGSPIFKRVKNQLIGSNKIALAAAAQKAEEFGLNVAAVSDDLSGDIEQAMQRILQQCRDYNGIRPACFLWGGETTVKIKGNGKGGRNQQLALQVFSELRRGRTDLQPLSIKNFTLLVAGTDGTDGPTDAAGAIVEEKIFERTTELGISPDIYLLNNDAYTYFEMVGGLFITGATQTNVMDLVVAILE